MNRKVYPPNVWRARLITLTFILAVAAGPQKLSAGTGVGLNNGGFSTCLCGRNRGRQSSRTRSYDSYIRSHRFQSLSYPLSPIPYPLSSK